MTRQEWELIYEMHSIIVEIISNSAVYSDSLRKRAMALDEKLVELPIEGE